MESQRTGAQRGRLLGGGLEQAYPFRVLSGINISPPVQVEYVAALTRQLFQEVDAAIHQPDHCIAGSGPEVSVAFGRLVARERQGRPLVDQQDISDSMLDRQPVSRGNAGNSCPAN